MTNKTLPINDSLYEYWLTTTVHESEDMHELRKNTRVLPTAMMQISPEQGQFMRFLIQLLQVETALEIGTYTGYSGLAIANALPEKGKLITCDHSIEFTALAQEAWKKAHLEEKIELRLGKALDTLDSLLEEKKLFDFIFIDADKVNYRNYYDRALQLLHPKGLILLDNMFLGGAVADPKNDLPATRAIRSLNSYLAQASDIDYCLLSIGDGLGLVRKKIKF